jgi:DNA-binding transcriptional LysR family regulator
MNQMRDDVLPPLKIAYSSTADIQALLPIIPIFKSKYPHAELQLNKIKLKDTDDYLERDLCDVAISFSAEFVESPSIKYKILQQGKYRAMIGKGHPLFEHDSITTAELYKYPLIMLSEKVIGNLYEKMVDRAKLDGFEPIIEKTVDDLETEMFSIITEGYIGFAPEGQSLADYGDAIRLIPIVDSSHKYIIAAGYSKANKNPTLEAFLNII